jgi:hypothetical protein
MLSFAIYKWIYDPVDFHNSPCKEPRMLVIIIHLHGKRLLTTKWLISDDMNSNLGFWLQMSTEVLSDTLKIE